MTIPANTSLPFLSTFTPQHLGPHSATVHITNETGEPAGSAEVVANAARWANA